MNLLAIETATPICAAALTQGEALVVEYRAALKNSHGRLLTRAVDALLADAGWRMSDLDAVAVSIGPGSFTGLRIGLAFAKGIAMAQEIPLVAVPTLAALAAQAPVAQGLIAALLRSRADEYYLGLYERSDKGDVPQPEVRIFRWPELAAEVPPEALLIGQSPQHPLPAGYHAAPAWRALLSAHTIARLGCRLLERDQGEKPDLLEPLYLQEFVVGKPKKAVFSPDDHVR
ncbi:MAG TPA: tRNA (adenosine(37)-N6)-threonylcarbamoyltransferase complex dimerization subunit type 1 TsaB [bacterium]|nr:tRNA (adenosine(37)-N6)-threonylcarbamoyltransferase complex dimerization subunit type 1 TsaB [bacterium]HPR89120.1 tRNA (adenosine(37)-N6)-threonylcarbamoyltransferase complex dimerization subunit type 1 TsaB [bacterium]